MSASTWRKGVNPGDIPPQGPRPIRQRRSPWLWERCEPRALLTLSINNATVVAPTSGTTDAVFTVSMSSNTNNNEEPVTVDFHTIDGMAVAGVDYQAVSGTLTFQPGETSH